MFIDEFKGFVSDDTFLKTQIKTNKEMIGSRSKSHHKVFSININQKF